MKLNKNKKLIIAIFLLVVSIVFLALIIDKAVWYYNYGSNFEWIGKNSLFNKEMEIPEIQVKFTKDDGTEDVYPLVTAFSSVYYALALTILESNKKLYNSFISGMSVSLIVSLLASLYLFYVVLSKKTVLATNSTPEIWVKK